MIIRSPFRHLILLLAVVFAASANAHTTLQAANPPSGSVLTASPPVLALTFEEPASLTSLTLVTAAGQKRLAFSPVGSALTFTTPRPPLVRGRNEIRWRALSRDGHVIEGSIIIVLRAPAR
ncbi:MAG: copper resistance CopC family protein [Casimicrobium sp.]